MRILASGDRARHMPFCSSARFQPACHILLDLPDPERGLHGRPEYTIRFANDGVWEPQTGFNTLRATLEVLP